MIRHIVLRHHRFWLILTALFVLAGARTTLADDWYPFPVQVWGKPFDQSSDRTETEYVPTDRATRKWDIAVFIPHMKDDYWLAVNYGLVSEAKRLGIRMQIYRAGGYEHLDKQVEQIRQYVDGTVDGIIVCGISYDGLNAVLEEIANKGVPIVDLINGMSSPNLTARTMTPYRDMGYTTGKYLVERHPAGSEPVKVAWFPGPEAAGWAQDGNRGFTEATAGSAVEIVVTKFGDTGKRVQTELLNEALLAHPDVKYVVGTSVTAEAAVGVLRRRRLRKSVTNIAYYFSPGVYRGIRQGRILAAPTDSPAIQARIALDQIVRILDGKDYHKHVGCKIHVIDLSNVQTMNRTRSLAPTGFLPTYTVN